MNKRNLCLALALLAATNLDVSAQDLSAQTLPFSCDFATAEKFNSEWTVENHNGDAITWEYNDWAEGTDGTTGCASCTSNSILGNDDYLISGAVTFEAGEHHASLECRSVRADCGETFELCIGTEANAASMKAIAQWSVMSREWKEKVVNFNIDNAGTYYIAIRSTSKGYNLFIDNLLVDKGSATLTPKPEIERIVLPLSQCDYSEATPVGVMVRNAGNGTATEATISYTIDNNEKITETVSCAIEPDKADTLYFTTRADMSEMRQYSITAEVAMQDATATATQSATHAETVADFPFAADFSTGADSRWSCQDDKAWSYSSMGACMETKSTGLANSLVSGCMQLEGDIRLKFAYSGGVYTNKASFYILVGLSGTDASTWQKVYEDDNVSSGGTEKEIDIDIAEPGLYAMAFVHTSTKTDVPLNLYYIDISNIYPYDVQAVEAITALSALTPEEQYNKEGKYSMVVKNRGSMPVSSIGLEMSIGGDKCFGGDIATDIPAGGEAEVTMTGCMPHAQAGTTVSGIKMTAAIDGEAYTGDNTVIFEDVTLTDSVFATECLTTFDQGTGQSYKTARFGNVYTLNHADTLTSVTIGLAADEQYVSRKIGIAVYSLKADGHTIDRQLFHTAVERGAESGLRTFCFEPRVLEAGSYYIEADQMTPDNMGIAIDTERKGAKFFQSDGSTLYTISGFGAIVLRANFGHGAKVYANDAKVERFTLPVKDNALYGANDSVAFVVGNMGTKAITDMPVRLTAGNIVREELVSLLPYEQKEVCFRDIDLSEPGRHTLTAEACLQEDGNTANNRLDYNITAKEEVSRYRLDFESCDDFDCLSMFNPRWKTVDRLGETTNAWVMYNYPHRLEPVGFMAFNTSATTPSMEDFQGFYAHSGQRFGAAFCTGAYDKESDVWLISPALKLEDSPKLSLYVKTFALEYGKELEHYRILVSDTDDNFDSFTCIGGVRDAAVEEWEEVVVDLGDYAGKTVHVALQYISTNRQGTVMMVDDIEVSSTTDGIKGTASLNNVDVTHHDGSITIEGGAPIGDIAIYTATGTEIARSSGTGRHSANVELPAGTRGVLMVMVTTAQGRHIEKIAIK